MNFDELHQWVPTITEGEIHSVKLHPYTNITLAMPGKHKDDTPIPGQDFVVMVTDLAMGWDKHQFKHDDIFLDVEAKAKRTPTLVGILMDHYYSVVHHNLDLKPSTWVDCPGVAPAIFLQAVQCLAVAEHRRYARFEPKLGGRYLPLRFAAGIAEGKWSAGEAMAKQKKGRPGVEWLERENGIPYVTRKLMYDVGLRDTVKE